MNELYRERVEALLRMARLGEYSEAEIFAATAEIMDAYTALRTALAESERQLRELRAEIEARKCTEADNHAQIQKQRARIEELERELGEQARKWEALVDAGVKVADIRGKCLKAAEDRALAAEKDAELWRFYETNYNAIFHGVTVSEWIHANTLRKGGLRAALQQAIDAAREQGERHEQ